MHRLSSERSGTRVYLDESEYEQSKYQQHKVARANERARVETIKEENEGESELSTILAQKPCHGKNDTSPQQFLAEYGRANAFCGTTDIQEENKAA